MAHARDLVDAVLVARQVAIGAPELATVLRPGLDLLLPGEVDNRDLDRSLGEVRERHAIDEDEVRRPVGHTGREVAVVNRRAVGLPVDRVRVPHALADDEALLGAPGEDHVADIEAAEGTAGRVGLQERAPLAMMPSTWPNTAPVFGGRFIDAGMLSEP